ncbi:MAG: hypothetical protein AB7U20_25105 [Planctomycetaceae bacterium]
MSLKELRDRYGESVDEQQIIDRAIHAELPGGAEALDARVQLDRLRRKSPGPDAEIAVQLIDEIIGAMDWEIRSRYKLEILDDST